MDQDTLMLTVAVLGGTGKEGKGLAYRWAKAGYQVLIGSRSSEKAVTAASEILELLDVDILQSFSGHWPLRVGGSKTTRGFRGRAVLSARDIPRRSRRPESFGGHERCDRGSV